MAISEQVIKSMYKHLTQSYSADEARDILIQKYPEAEGDIENLLTMDLTEDVEPVEAAEDTLAKVKKATAKQKPAKAPKSTKMSRAKELYNKAQDQSRGAMIELFTKELGLSKAAASTYFYSVKK
jgi:hypothetical protein